MAKTSLVSIYSLHKKYDNLKKSHIFQVYLKRRYVREIIKLKSIIKVDEKLMSALAKENRELQSQLNL